MEQRKRPMPMKYDTVAQRTKKPLSRRKKLAILMWFDRKMARGNDRDDILRDLKQKLNLSPRQIERIISEAREYIKETERHLANIYAIALKLAEILDWYVKYGMSDINPLISSDFPYTPSAPGSPILDEHDLSNLVDHLEGEIPELTSILKYSRKSKEWSGLGNKKWDMETPSVNIDEELIIKLKAIDRVNLSGKCPDCPRCFVSILNYCTYLR